MSRNRGWPLFEPFEAHGLFDCAHDYRKDLGALDGHAQLFNRTESDSVGLAQSAIDGTGLSDPHFGTSNKGRNVRGIGVAVANETLSP